MPDFPPPGYRLMIVDDDALMREALTLLTQRAGFEVESFESGAEVLEALAATVIAGGGFPQAVLADLQMPGPSGETLAKLARAACGAATALLAMSGTAVPAEHIQTYDGFLWKPFTIAELCAALQGTDRRAAEEMPQQTADSSDVALNATTFDTLSQSMPRERLRELYAMCLDDADLRIGVMQQAAADRDAGAWRRAAHSIKGGCGMVGAVELAKLAAAMETTGIPDVDDQTPFREFLAASSRLRRILATQIT